MDKTLIVASLSVLAMLFFAHTAGSIIEPSPSSSFILEQKCSDAPKQSDVGECGGMKLEKPEPRSELFMRKTKRKARLLYA